MSRTKMMAMALIMVCAVATAAQERKERSQPSQTDGVSNSPAAQSMSSMPAMSSMPSHQMDMEGMEQAQAPRSDDESAAPAVRAMSSHHMDMGPHMKMTALRQPRPGDWERADAIAWTARLSLEKYRDYRAALEDGYRIFLPNVPQRVYHFTNYRYAIEAVLQLDPELPTSLLYEKTADGYRLVGAMYTAPANASEEELDERIPLSVAQWHQHVNFCVPPRNRRQELFQPHTLFGLEGSISTRQACEKAGGRFVPRMFGWMVHIYPFEQKPEDIWALETSNGRIRQNNTGNAVSHGGRGSAR